MIVEKFWTRIIEAIKNTISNLLPCKLFTKVANANIKVIITRYAAILSNQ